MSYWDYRLMRHKKQDEKWLEIHEVYYNKTGQVVSWTIDSETPVGKTRKQMTSTLELMKKASRKPIMDYTKYPRNWKQLSQRVRDEAKQCCEFCGVQNREWILRHGEGMADWRYCSEGEVNDWTLLGKGEWDNKRFHPVQIILTVAHLDHDTTNNDRANLKALCQKCHLNYDLKQHISNAALTRRKKQIALGQSGLMLELN